MTDHPHILTTQLLLLFISADKTWMLEILENCCQGCGKDKTSNFEKFGKIALLMKTDSFQPDTETHSLGNAQKFNKSAVTYTRLQRVKLCFGTTSSQTLFFFF